MTRARGHRSIHQQPMIFLFTVHISLFHLPINQPIKAMKLLMRTFFIFSSLLSGSAGAASCQVCGGSEYRDMIIPSADLSYATCQEVVTVAAATTNELSEDCLVLRAAVEAFCCPSAAFTCSICQGAELYGDLELPMTDGSIYTCGQFAFDLGRNMLDIASQDCIAVQTWEELCCPDAFVPQPVVTSTSPPISIPSPSPTDFIGISTLSPTIFFIPSSPPTPVLTRYAVYFTS